jgi:hypothetical protein
MGTGDNDCGGPDQKRAEQPKHWANRSLSSRPIVHDRPPRAPDPALDVNELR